MTSALPHDATFGLLHTTSLASSTDPSAIVKTGYIVWLGDKELWTTTGARQCYLFSAGALWLIIRCAGRMLAIMALLRCKWYCQSNAE